MPIKVGKIVEGTVTGITNFGAFVELPGGKTGLVHISEVADAYVKNIHRYLSRNEKVKVKVINIDDKGKISLSMRQVKDNKKSTQPIEIDWMKTKRQDGMSFEDKLLRFMRESEEKQKILKRNQSKRKSFRLKGREGY